jgi:hypothetical protein
MIFRKDFMIPSCVCYSALSNSKTDHTTLCILALLGFERQKDDGLSRTEAYEEVGNSIEDLIEACRKIAKKLSLKKARTKVIDTMIKMMCMVPELIRDWQESSAHGVTAHVLVMCKAHFPTLDFAKIAVGVPKPPTSRSSSRKPADLTCSSPTK